MRRKHESAAGIQDGVVYRDLHYASRLIRVGDDEIEVRDGRAMVTDPAHIDALDQMYGMQREDK